MKWILALICLTLSGSLAAETTVLAFAGSTREGSFNKKLVREAADIARQLGATVTIVDLKDYPIPFYDADLEATQAMPPNAKSLRSQMLASNAIIIATPEYNGSLSAVLKNTIDWLSRNDEGKPSRDAFKGKKFAILSTSPGPTGGSRAAAHLRTIIENLGGEVVSKQVSIPNAGTAFNAKGLLENDSSKKDLREEIQQLLQKN